MIITSLAAYRLVRNADQIVEGPIEVRALVFGKNSIDRVDVQIEDGDWAPMRRDMHERLWISEVIAPTGPQFT